MRRPLEQCGEGRAALERTPERDRGHAEPVRHWQPGAPQIFQVRALAADDSATLWSRGRPIGSLHLRDGSDSVTPHGYMYILTQDQNEATSPM